MAKTPKLETAAFTIEEGQLTRHASGSRAQFRFAAASQKHLDGGFDVEREVICVNGQLVWFPIAVVPPVSDHERLVTDGAARTAEENVAVLLNGLGEHVDGGAAAPDVDGQDGTERLCQALYGRKATPRDYLGGSDARMLHDAADRLIKRAPANPALEGF